MKDINSKIKISASILNSDLTNLSLEIKKLEEAGVDMVHIDVMDGNFVPNISFGSAVVNSIRQKTELFLDVHLMVKNPDNLLDNFIESGADLITVHVEECPHLDKTLDYIKQAGKKVAAALNPATPINMVENVLNHTDMILVMTVNPGFGGQKFIYDMVYKIKKLKKLIEDYKSYSDRPKKNIDIQADGGINMETVQLVTDAGANVLVMGTAIFSTPDPVEYVKNIRKKVSGKLPGPI